MLKEGGVQAVVSAGNSGAVMAFAIFTLGRIPGVERPAILTIHPTIKGTMSVLLDAGGTVDCKSSHLVQFAIMGDIFARYALGIAAPNVGLLSNGEEETKGNDLTRETNALLKHVNINYMGCIEGTDLHNGTADVVITDGFVGNVALKVTEGVAEAIAGFLKEKIKGNIRTKIGYMLLSDVFKAFSRMVDYSEYGGAPLVGVDGTCIICHGKSNQRAIKNAILQAKGLIGKDLNKRIRNAIQDQSTILRSKEQ
jgi:glycerol-3-phosphate acyltransferase PlsX